MTNSQALSRRGFIAAVGAGAGAAALDPLSILRSAEAADAGRRPNVVMIVSDDHGWPDYSFMGHPHVQTPNLDKLAAQSVTFTRGYVPSALCCPSLASIITGLYPHQTKITCNDPPLDVTKLGPKSEAYQAQRRQMSEFIDQAPALPRTLAGQGYVSFQTGKWWQGHFSHGGFTHGMSHGDPNQGGRHGDAGLGIGRQTMQPIFDFIEMAGKERKPFFVWYAPMMPHLPHNPPARLADKYKPKTPSSFIADYWAMVEWFDETCGQLLDRLDQKGLAENTIVVYVTDNGWIQRADQRGASPKSKLSPYDGGLRTPIMIRWPSKAKPRRSDRLAISIDLAPTLLNAVGLKPPPDMQGVDMLNDDAVARRTAIFGECFTHNAVDIHRPASSLRHRWVIEGEWKLIVPAPHALPNASPELYHLVKDQFEEKNLAEQEAERVEALRQKLDAWWPGKV